MCTQARVRKEQFRLLQGEHLIRVYGKGEGAVKRSVSVAAQACLVAIGRKAMKFPFAWELLTTIRASVRNIIPSSMTAQHGMKLLIICRSIPSH